MNPDSTELPEVDNTELPTAEQLGNQPAAPAYEHRSEDEDGNPDDKFNEDEALAKAADEGIEFETFYLIVDADSHAPIDGVEYPTKAKASKQLAQLDGSKGNFSIAEGRRRKVQAE